VDVAYIFGPNPKNEDEKLLVATDKCRFGERPLAVLFETDQVETYLADGKLLSPGVLRIVRDDVDIHASAVLAGPPKDREAPRLEEAAEFLHHLLRGGPVARNEVKARAEVEDISWATIRRAAKKMGIIPRGAHGPGSYSTWELPYEVGDDDGE
jgi:hypothetical protein